MHTIYGAICLTVERQIFARVDPGVSTAVVIISTVCTVFDTFPNTIGVTSNTLAYTLRPQSIDTPFEINTHNMV